MAAAPTTDISEVHVVSAEKRADGGKQIFFQIQTTYNMPIGKIDRIWRRYHEFESLHQTMARILGPSVPLPKPSNSFFLRLSARQATILRMGQLQVFLAQLLTFRSNSTAYKVICFFLTPTAADLARVELPDPPNIVRPEKIAEKAITKAVVLEDYEAQTDLEVSLRKGEIVNLISTENKEYFVGETENKFVGRFPSHCVELLTTNEQDGTTNPTTGAAAAPKTPTEELRTTEQAYMRGLVDVRSHFFPKLRTLITAQEAKILFNNWSELIPASQDLLAALEGDPVAALTTHLPRLTTVYSRYCAGIPGAQALYNRKLGERAFAEFESSFAHLNKPTLNYVMRPAQRIMKYPLLIHEIRKHLPAGHPDRPALDAAYTAAAALAEQANASMTAPAKRLDKLDISNPNQDSFQVTSAAVAGDGSSIASAHGPDVWMQTELQNATSNRLLVDLLNSTMAFEEWHSVLLDRFQHRIHDADLGVAAGLWDVMLGTTVMQCELAGDMEASLAAMLGSATAEIDSARLLQRQTAVKRDALGNVPAAINTLQRSRLDLEQRSHAFSAAQEQYRLAVAAVAADEKKKPQLQSAKASAIKAAEEYTSEVAAYADRHASYRNQLAAVAEAVDEADNRLFHATRAILEEYCTAYSRRNETATAVLESAQLKLATREPKTLITSLSSAAIAESVLPARHEFVRFTAVDLRDGASVPVWAHADRLRTNARNAGRVLARVVSGGVAPILRRIRPIFVRPFSHEEETDEELSPIVTTAAAQQEMVQSAQPATSATSSFLPRPFQDGPTISPSRSQSRPSSRPPTPPRPV
eukprot:m.64288 g.64288  ORF g.64288 m.64288 type:complete len:813 (-) comp12513_c0_seq2:28-2466(-)